MGEPPDGGQGRIGLVALDLRNDRLGDAGLDRQIGQRKAVALAQLENGAAELVGERRRARFQNLGLVLALDAHVGDSLEMFRPLIKRSVRNIERRCPDLGASCRLAQRRSRRGGPADAPPPSLDPRRRGFSAVLV